MKQPRASLRWDWAAFAGFVAALIIFYPELVLSKSASLMGDHIEQHYPWAYLFASSLKQGILPFWTPLIQSGFPIAAESQIGIFYIPNIILYGLLPFHSAYAYMNVVHFLIAGWTTYLYLRFMNLDRLPSFTGAFVFLFGAAYGGAYYNITSLKTICWLPLGLYLFESYYQKSRFRYLLALAVTVGMSLVAGYMQVAALTWFIFSAYVIFRIFLFPESGDSRKFIFRHIAALFFTMMGALLIALPQLLLTFELAIRSNRTGLEEGYAYVGSLSPFALSTLIDPVAQRLFRGNSLYLGLFPAFLFLIPFFSRVSRKDKRFRLWLALTLFSLLMALGQWSPLYIAFVKLTKFYSFRTPAKFLVFVCFGLSLLSALGLQRLIGAFKDDEARRSVLKTGKCYLALIGAFLAGSGLVYYFATAGKRWSMMAGEWFIRNFIYGQPGRPHSLEAYLDRLALFPESVLSLFSLKEWVNGWTYGLIGFSFLLVLFLLKTKKISKVWLAIGLIFLIVDLYGYAWFDIKRDFASYEKALKPSATVEALKAEQKSGEFGRLYEFRQPGEELPMVPSINMLYGIEDIGGYSPLLMGRYHETIGRFGNINDSNFAYAPDTNFLFTHLPLLNSLNVSHMISGSEINHENWTLLMQDREAKVFLYKNQAEHSGAFFVNRVKLFPEWHQLKDALMGPNFDPKIELLLERSEAEKIGDLRNAMVSLGDVQGDISRVEHAAEEEIWRIQNSGAGFFVVTQTMYPGWKAERNGIETPILKAYGLFRAVWVAEAGEHKIRFYYKPFERATA